MATPKPETVKALNSLRDEMMRLNANFFAAMLTIDSLAANPMTSAEVINEATQTIVDMEANLQRLFDKYGVLPAPSEPVEEEPSA